MYHVLPKLCLDKAANHTTYSKILFQYPLYSIYIFIYWNYDMVIKVDQCIFSMSSVAVPVYTYIWTNLLSRRVSDQTSPLRILHYQG